MAPQCNPQTTRDAAPDWARKSRDINKTAAFGRAPIDGPLYRLVS